MLRGRSVTRDIWRAVVVAGGMLGAAGCSSSPKPAPAAPAPAPVAATPVVPEAPASPDPAVQAVAAQPAPPDAGVPDAAPAPVKRPRGTGGKPRGRGFVIA